MSLSQPHDSNRSQHSSVPATLLEHVLVIRVGRNMNIGESGRYFKIAPNGCYSVGPYVKNVDYSADQMGVLSANQARSLVVNLSKLENFPDFSGDAYPNHPIIRISYGDSQKVALIDSSGAGLNVSWECRDFAKFARELMAIIKNQS